MTTTTPKKTSSIFSHQNNTDLAGQLTRLLDMQNGLLTTSNQMLIKPVPSAEALHQLKKADTQAQPELFDETVTISDMKRWAKMNPHNPLNPPRRY